jgi:hypothetical protein
MVLLREELVLKYVLQGKVGHVVPDWLDTSLSSLYLDVKIVIIFIFSD